MRKRGSLEEVLIKRELDGLLYFVGEKIELTPSGK